MLTTTNKHEKTDPIPPVLMSQVVRVYTLSLRISSPTWPTQTAEMTSDHCSHPVSNFPLFFSDSPDIALGRHRKG